MVSRIALVSGPDGLPLSLMSDLSHHSTALKANPLCALLIGEPEDKGDPLTHPRLSLRARAHFVRHGTSGHGSLADAFCRNSRKQSFTSGLPISRWSHLRRSERI